MKREVVGTHVRVKRVFKRSEEGSGDSRWLGRARWPVSGLVSGGTEGLLECIPAGGSWKTGGVLRVHAKLQSLDVARRVNGRSRAESAQRRRGTQERRELSKGMCKSPRMKAECVGVSIQRLSGNAGRREQLCVRGRGLGIRGLSVLNAD